MIALAMLGGAMAVVVFGLCLLVRHIHRQVHALQLKNRMLESELVRLKLRASVEQAMVKAMAGN